MLNIHNINYKNILCLKSIGQNLSGGPMVKNPPSNAGGIGSIPGQGTKILHFTGQLSPHATTRETESCSEQSHIRPEVAK